MHGILVPKIKQCNFVSETKLEKNGTDNQNYHLATNAGGQSYELWSTWFMSQNFQQMAKTKYVRCVCVCLSECEWNRKIHNVTNSLL